MEQVEVIVDIQGRDSLTLWVQTHLVHTSVTTILASHCPITRCNAEHGDGGSICGEKAGLSLSRTGQRLTRGQSTIVPFEIVSPK